jgi:hypothetical protein
MPFTRGRDQRNCYRYPNYRYLARCVVQLTEALREGMIERVYCVKFTLYSLQSSGSGLDPNSIRSVDPDPEGHK